MYDSYERGSLMGATIIYTWDGEEQPTEGYVSFGTYNEAREMDSFGVDDDYIFYYAEDQQDLFDQESGVNGWRLLAVQEWHYDGRL